MNFLTPGEIIEGNMNGAVKKAELSIGKMILLGILAGMFIGFGSEASSLAAHTIADVGLARLVAGAVFPVGLMLVVFLGAELFTGNCTMIMGVMDGRVKFAGMVKNLIVVYFSNMIGGVLLAAMVSASGQWNYTNGALGAYTIKVAYGKAGLDFKTALISGILCNILVCLAVLAAAAAKDIAGKCLVIFFVILAFVVSGFEHCVANMYYLFAGYFASLNDTYLAKAVELYGLDADKIKQTLEIGNLFTSNLIPVTIGNIIGGMVFTALPLFLVYGMKKSSK